MAAPSLTITAGAGDTHRVQKTGNYEADIPDGQDHPVMEAIDSFSLAMYREDAIDGESAPTGQAGTPFMVVQPELVVSLRRWLRDKGLSFDPLTAEILSQNPAMADATGYVGNLSGVRLYSWNHLPIPTGVNWQAYAGVTQAVAVAILPPLVRYFDPLTNQKSDNPQHLLEQVGDWGAVEVMDKLHRKINIRAGS